MRPRKGQQKQSDENQRGKHQFLKIMNEIFTNSQFNKTSHEKNSKKLKSLYDKVDENEFTQVFIRCMKIVFARQEKHLHVDNVIHFAAKFAVSLYDCTGEEDEENNISPFLTDLLKFLLELSDAVNMSVRLKVCQFLNLFLNSMGDGAYIDDDMCSKIMSSMMNRLLDKSPKVRAQAVYTLSRLQDPQDENCPVTKMYLFHLGKDPGVDVRVAVIKAIAKSQKSLVEILKRTRDISESVRKEAYLFLTKITLRSLSIKQRNNLLENGFNDSSEQVRKIVRKELFPRWLAHFHNNFLDLLYALDAQTASPQAILAITTLFQNTDKNVLLNQLPIDPNTKMISIENLTAENVIYWKILIKHFQKESRVELLEDCIPELSTFCKYIQDYQVYIKNKEYSNDEKLLHNFILYELFEISQTFDLSDEFGRENLTKLTVETLMSDLCSEKMIKLLLDHYELLVPDVTNRIDNIANVISEIKSPSKLAQIEVNEIEESEEVYNQKKVEIQKLKLRIIELEEVIYQKTSDKQFLEAHRVSEEVKDLQNNIRELESKLKSNPIIPQPCSQATDEIEEKNDPETLIKCLQIMYHLMQHLSITKLTSTLRSLFDHMVLPNLENTNMKLHISVLQAATNCLLLDSDLAKNYWALYFLQLRLDNYDVWIVSLKTLFDLFLFYGLDFFDIHHNDPDDNSKKHRSVRLHDSQDPDDETDLADDENDNNKSSQQDIVKILIESLDSDDSEIRTIVTEGFCKLLLHKRLSSVQLVCRLIILLFNPATEEDDVLRQNIILLFKYYVLHIEDSLNVLERAFMPVLKTILNAPDNSPLQEIEPHRVAEFILNLTDPKVNRSEDYNVHNNLAFTILGEALLPDSEIDKKTLIKSLKHLNIKCSTEQTKRDMMEAIDKIDKIINPSDKTLKNSIKKFRAGILGNDQQNPDKQNEENKENEEENEESQNENEESEDSE